MDLIKTSLTSTDGLTNAPSQTFTRPAPVAEEAPKTTLTPLPKPLAPKAQTTAPQPVHVHHGLIGIGIMVGGIVAALVAPTIKPTTRAIVGASAFALGAALLWDDVQAHLESRCGFDTWLNFTPCPESASITVVKRLEEKEG